MKERFLDEYRTDDAIKKYSNETAGDGITYLLENEYGEIYLEVIRDVLRTGEFHEGLRILEFGSGAGMNLISLLNRLGTDNISIDAAYGTDFSSRLLEVARSQADGQLTSSHLGKVRFCLASNENLLDDLSNGLGVSKDQLSNTFHFIFGVNTYRYCYRLNSESECSRNIYELLVKGGACVIIDMNDRFPFYRSRLRDRLTKPKAEYYLPTLDEYVESFQSAGFEIIKKDNFCWIPHSSSGVSFELLKYLSPILDRLAPHRAMRSLVIAHKPPC